MIAQALVKIGRGPEWVDGDVIQVVTPGVWFTYEEVLAWTRGTEPDKLVPSAQKEQVGVWIEVFAYQLAHEEKDALSTLALMEKHGGYHTRFGFGDLCKHAAITVTCDQFQHQDALLPQLRAEKGNIIQVKPRVFRFAYEEVLTAEVIEEIRGPKLVLPSSDAVPFNLQRK